MNRTNYLVKNTLLFSISTFSSKIITFLMVPFYTLVLNSSQFGTIDVIYTTVSLVVPIIALNIHNAVLRFAMDKSAKPSLVFSNGLFVTMTGSLLGLAAMPVLFSVNGFKENGWLIYLLFILQCVYLLFSEFARGLEKIRKYVAGNIILVVMTALLNLLMLGAFKWGIYGYILSSCLAYVIAILYLAFAVKLKQYVTFRSLSPGNRELFQSMIVYSVFLIPNSLFWWITNLSDKYIILYLLGSAFNGLYAVANKIPVIVTSISQVFIQSWQLSAIKANGTEDSNEYANFIYQRLFALDLLITSFILVILKAFMRIYVTDEYFLSWQSSTFLILSATFNIMASFLGVNYVVAKKNLNNMLSTMVGAFVNIALNFLLIPNFGLTGAGFATFFSYFVVVIYRLVDTRKYVKIKPVSMGIGISFAVTILQIIVLFLDGSLISVWNISLFGLILFVNRRLFREIWVGLLSKIKSRCQKDEHIGDSEK